MLDYCTRAGHTVLAAPGGTTLVLLAFRLKQHKLHRNSSRNYIFF